MESARKRSGRGSSVPTPVPWRTLVSCAIALVASLALAAPAAAQVEVGQCEPVAKHGGQWEGNACLVKGGSDNHEWDELTAGNPLARYADGEEDIRRDEPQEFTAAGWHMHCWETTNGTVTSWTTNEQVIHDWYCEQTLPSKAKCSNAVENGTEEEVEFGLEHGTYVELSETLVEDRFTDTHASFTCGGVPVTIEGGYECRIGLRTGANRINLLIHIYDCEAGPGTGEQALTVTVGLEAPKPLTMEGEQEDRFDDGTTRLVVRTDPKQSKRTRFEGGGRRCLTRRQCPPR